MMDKAIAVAGAIAIELVKRDTDPNELGKVGTYLRTHLDGAQFFRLLESMVEDGRYLVRTGRTLDYYRDIQDVCQRNLGAYRKAKDMQAREMAQILGWAVRLMRYYKGEGAQPLTTPLSKVDSSPTPSDSVLKDSPQRGVGKKLDSKPARVTRTRELVTLAEDAKRGKAQVQTKDGELIVCTGFLPIPVAERGMRCRAEVTRQDGKAQRATFKIWE